MQIFIIKDFINMKPIKLTEDKIRQIVSESLKKILKENRFSDNRSRIIATAHAIAKRTGRSYDDVFDELIAKYAAINDINKDISKQRTAQNIDPYNDDKDFYKSINHNTLDIDTDSGVFGDSIDINDDEEAINEVGGTAPTQRILGRLSARRHNQAMGEYNMAVNSKSDEERELHMRKMGDFMSRSLNASDKARDEREKLPHRIAQHYSNVYHSGEDKENK